LTDPSQEAAPADDAVVTVRADMARIASEFMIERMGMQRANVEQQVNRALQPGCAWLEYAHTPHLMHLGTARILRSAAEQARNAKGSLVFCINDHLPARELAESRYLPLKLTGAKTPQMPSLGTIGRAAKQAMSELTAPSELSMRQFMQRWTQLEPGRTDSIKRICADLSHISASSRDHAAFLARVMLYSTGTEALCIPSSALDMELLCDPALRAALAPRTWWHCANCGYRLARAESGQAEPGHSSCPVCTFSEAPVRRPDVICRQVLLNQCQLAVRFCGASKPYQAVADQHPGGSACRAPQRQHFTGRLSIDHPVTGMAVDRVNLLEWLTRGGAMDVLVGSDPAQDISLPCPKGIEGAP
jgi:hypothetical protein